MSSSGTTILVNLGDQRRSRTDSHGIIGFSLGLVRSLPASLTASERVVVLVNDELRDELADIRLRPGDALRTIPAPTSLVARMWFDHVGVLREARHAGADVVLYPKGFLPVRPRPPRGLRQVPCLHDDIPVRARTDRSLPWRRRARAAYFTALLRWSLRQADRRLFVSHFTAGRLADLGGGARSSDTVVHEGISLPRQAVRPLGDRQRQALVLGSTHPHKRTDAGLDLIGGSPALRDLVDRVVVLGPLDPPRVATGDLPVEHRPGPVPSAALAALIAESRLLVYPSDYEGFGLPPIEAYALGTPAVYRRTEAAREVLYGVPGGFDDERPSAFEAAVLDAASLTDADLERLSAQMWERFDWRVVADVVAGALRSEAAESQA